MDIKVCPISGKPCTPSCAWYMVHTPYTCAVAVLASSIKANN